MKITGSVSLRKNEQPFIEKIYSDFFHKYGSFGEQDLNKNRPKAFERLLRVALCFSV